MFKYEKVSIARHLSKGLSVGKVIMKTSTDKIKIEMPDNEKIWYSKELLRKIKCDNNFQFPEENDIVRVVDIKGIYSKEDLIGKIGLVTWTQADAILVDIGEENPRYVEVGDVKKVPEKKKAWVVIGCRIERLLCFRKSCVGGHLTWKTENNYVVSDRVVFDSITKALDYQYDKLDSNDKLLVNYD